MALYDTMFSQVRPIFFFVTLYNFFFFFLSNMRTFFTQLDVTSSQLLVTDGVFRDEAFKKQLSETVDSLVSLRVIPIFNENDAVSTRREPLMV